MRSHFKKRRKFRNLPILMRCAPPLLVLLVALLAACHREAGVPTASPAPQAVQAILPRRGEIARSITLPAFRILALQEATLYAKVAGYLKTVLADKGDQVRTGQLLAEIEVPELLADAAQFQAEQDVASTNYQRLLEARQKAPDLVVPQTVDDLHGQLQIAQAKLQRTRSLMQYSRITAPFDGIVTARYADPGAFLPAATAGSTPQSAALMTVMDYRRVRVQVFVPEVEVLFITNGVPVSVSLEELPGRNFTGSVTRFAHALDSATKTMLAEIELPNADGALRPGAYAKVRLEVERKTDALLIPVRALVVEKVGASVFKPVGGRAKKVPVHTGFNDGVNVEILDGVAQNEPILLSAKQPLTDNQLVTITETK